MLSFVADNGGSIKLHRIKHQKKSYISVQEIAVEYIIYSDRRFEANNSRRTTRLSTATNGSTSKKSEFELAPNKEWSAALTVFGNLESQQSSSQVLFVLHIQ